MADITEVNKTSVEAVSSRRADIETELNAFNDLIKEYGGVDSYTTMQAASLCELIYEMVGKLGMDPESSADFFEGLKLIFNMEVIHMGDYAHGKYCFVPNHVSEFDGLIFGTIIPNMLVVAKSDWGSNPRLNAIIEKYFSIVAVIRKDNASGMNVLRKCIEHFREAEDSALTVFVQQTIADLDITRPEDVASGAFHIAEKAGAQIVPVYCEQPTRIVFGEPMNCTDKDGFGKAWIECEKALRDSITSPAARPPVLCEKHQKPISEREF